jgi:hypothetical protein
MPVILATEEAVIRRITVQNQPRQRVHKTLSQKTLHKHRTGGVAQSVGSEFKPQYYKGKAAAGRRVDGSLRTYVLSRSLSAMKAKKFNLSYCEGKRIYGLM